MAVNSNQYLLSARLKLIALIVMLLFLAIYPIWSISSGETAGTRITSFLEIAETTTQTDPWSAFILFYAPFVSGIICGILLLFSYLGSKSGLLVISNAAFFVLIALCLAVIMKSTILQFIVLMLPMYYWYRYDVVKWNDQTN